MWQLYHNGCHLEDVAQIPPKEVPGATVTTSDAFNVWHSIIVLVHLEVNSYCILKRKHAKKSI